MGQRLEKILDGAEKVFHKYGIRGVSMDDICKDLGISKKTLYKYVDNKEDLLSRIVDRDIERHSRHIQKLSDKGTNAIDELFEVSKIISEAIKRINPSYSFDLNKYYPELFRKHKESLREFVHKRIKENIERGIEEDFYREDLDVELIAKLYINKLEFVHDPEFNSNQDISFSQVFSVMFENHIRGISNNKGIEYLEQKKKSLNFKI